MLQFRWPIASSKIETKTKRITHVRFQKLPRNVKGPSVTLGGRDMHLMHGLGLSSWGALRGPCGDRTSAKDLHLNFTDTSTTLYLLKFLNKQQHTDTGHQLQKNV